MEGEGEDTSTVEEGDKQIQEKTVASYFERLQEDEREKSKQEREEQERKKRLPILLVVWIRFRCPSGAVTREIFFQLWAGNRYPSLTRLNNGQVTLPAWAREGGEVHEVILQHDCLIDEVKVRTLPKWVGQKPPNCLIVEKTQQTIWRQIPALWDCSRNDCDLMLATRFASVHVSRSSLTRRV
jgi:hypothetical protein